MTHSCLVCVIVSRVCSMHIAVHHHRFCWIAWTGQPAAMAFASTAVASNTVVTGAWGEPEMKRWWTESTILVDCTRWYYSMFWGLSWSMNSEFLQGSFFWGSFFGDDTSFWYHYSTDFEKKKYLVDEKWLTFDDVWWRLMTFDDIWHIFLVVFVSFFNQMNYEEHNGERNLQRCGF